jgi:D-3-phosphoglycerate dehydrogenase
MREADLDRLAKISDWEFLEFPESDKWQVWGPSLDPTDISRLAQAAPAADAIVVCHYSPAVTETIMDAAPRLRFIGELEGDRFGLRLDLPAAWKRGIKAVDTTNGSSYPVAEWALALIIIALKNVGMIYRDAIKPIVYERPAAGTEFSWDHGELYGKNVGLIGGGHIARRLMKFLTPFECRIEVCDPYLGKDMAESHGFTLTSLQHVMSDNDVVVCTVPLTPATRGMLGVRELGWLPPGSVFVNVSRGAVVDSDALVARLERGDICAGLDVFDPEPIPADSRIKTLPNVFITPHIASYTKEAHPRMFKLMVDELERFFAGHETLFDLTPRSKANRDGTTP